MGQLALKGHQKQGGKVIEILEMLGGNNANNCYGDYHAWAYYINENGYIDRDFIAHIEQNTNFIIYTLEEFLEKFPYKVGDKVKNARINDFIGKIINARWDNNEEQIIYTVEFDDVTKSTLTYFARGLQPYKEVTMDRKYNVEEYLKVWEETEKGLEVVVNDKFELKEDNGRFYIIKKQLQYPKTYEECCEILDILGNINAEGYKKELLLSLQQLLICRDAYWKIAGEQMGLGKPWKPENPTKHYIFTIENCGGDIVKNAITCKWINRILAFPTEEMRDTFYNNFKELINEVKELL